MVANGFVFLSGQVPTNPEADIEAQTADVLAQIDRILADCGSDKAHICEAVIYLPDMADYAGMNRVWDTWVAPGKAPAGRAGGCGLESGNQDYGTAAHSMTAAAFCRTIRAVSFYMVRDC